MALPGVDGEQFGLKRYARLAEIVLKLVEAMASHGWSWPACSFRVRCVCGCCCCLLISRHNYGNCRKMLGTYKLEIS